MQDQITALQPKSPPVVPSVKRKVYLGASDLSQFQGVPATLKRSYYGLLDTGFKPAVVLAQAKAVQAQRMTLMSIDRGKQAKGGVAPDVSKLAQFGPAITANPLTRLILHHEPENDFTSAPLATNVAGYQAWFTAAAQWVRANCPNVKIGPCLMAWTLRNGGPGVATWLNKIDRALIDFFAVDGYANPGKHLADLPLLNALSVAKALDVPLIIAETGQEQTADQAGWLAELLAWAQDNKEIEAISWWPGDGPNEH